ncbi:MAG: DegT/DnrJ/EryC1/StrS family aminotransferase [Planctomycetaceae bacterium]|nr:DegT/DnrJ/EryC1/StrS family aminotransferase [Planctomycetaceae bacterium]
MMDSLAKSSDSTPDAPILPEVLHVGRPNLGNREAFDRRVAAIWENNWLTNNGPFVQEFEQRIAEHVNVRHCVCMCNATVALEIATRAIGLTGEVIVPSFTFVATAHALQWQEIQPVFCDIDPLTHNLDARCVEQLITPRTSGIIGVHLWGRPCDTNALQAVADRHGLKLLFDAAHAFGCSRQGRMIGGFGRAEVFSFHATKFVNAFEGGAVVTDDDELAGKMRLMRNFGFSGLDHVIHVGTNGKMSEVSAAMGLTSLESLDEFVNVNRRNWQSYHDHLADLPGVTVLPYDAQDHPNYQYVVLEIDEAATGISRDQLMEKLHAANVRARRYFWPGVHRMEPYRSLYPKSHLWLPHTEEVASRVLLMPTGTAVNEQTIETICRLIRQIVERAVTQQPHHPMHSRSIP